MMNAVYALVGVLLILVVSEYMWRKGIVRGEYARKFVHIFTGTFVAFWPLFLSWRAIQVISLLFLAVIIITRSLNRYVDSDFYRNAKRRWFTRWWFHLFEIYRQLNIFHAAYDVRRRTNGEELFAIGIFLTATLAPHAWQFSLAILVMTLSDGLAAVMGTKYGKRSRYTIFGATKSWLGNLTFFLTTLALLVGLSWTSIEYFEHRSILMGAVPIALLLTCVEALSAKGSDNITIPLTTIIAINLLLM